jgi:hypothetical protein
MSFSQNKYDAIENLIFKEGLRINSVDFSTSSDKMFVHLTNKVVFIIPTQLYKNLKNAKGDSLRNFKLIADNTGIYWPDLDEDLSLKGFLKDYLKQKIQTEKELVLS